MTSGRRRNLIGQPVDALWLRKAGDRKFAKVAPQRRTGLRKTRRGDDRAAETARDLFQPCRQIDRRSDAGEVEPVAAADIAIQDAPDMQRHAEAKALDGF